MAADKQPARQTAGGANGAQRLRSLPSVDRVISHPLVEEARSRLPHEVVTAAAAAGGEAARRSLLQGDTTASSLENIAQRAARRAFAMATPSLRPVINATG